MQQLLHAINNSGFTLLSADSHSVAADSAQSLAGVNLPHLSLSVGRGAVANLMLVNGDEHPAIVTIELESDAKLNLTHLLAGTAAVNVVIKQAQGASSKVVAASLKCSTASFEVVLGGTNASSEVFTIQLGAEKEYNSININMQHQSPDCTSRSLSKCVASGESNLHFDGLVYVAQDAQRTAAEQNCRCIELSDSSHIVAHPQLEIYADDVKCSHGATMGQVDTDAILYMRQRGLSEAQARRVQIEGFVRDIVEHCPLEQVREALSEVVENKLQEM